MRTPLQFVLGLGLLVALYLIVTGCEVRAGKAAAVEQIQKADEKKQAQLTRARFDHPLGTTWILQAGNDAQGNPIVNPRRRYSFAADLTRRSE